MLEHVAYMRDRLIPDFQDARCPETAGDFTKCANMIEQLLDDLHDAERRRKEVIDAYYISSKQNSKGI